MRGAHFSNSTHSVLLLYTLRDQGRLRQRYLLISTYVCGVVRVSPESSGVDWPTQKISPFSAQHHTGAALSLLGQDKGEREDASGGVLQAPHSGRAGDCACGGMGRGMMGEAELKGRYRKTH